MGENGLKQQEEGSFTNQMRGENKKKKRSDWVDDCVLTEEGSPLVYLHFSPEKEVEKCF